MAVNTTTYVKLQYDDYTILENVLESVDSLTADETIVLGKIKKIIQLMVEKRERMKNDSNSEMEQ